MTRSLATIVLAVALLAACGDGGPDPAAGGWIGAEGRSLDWGAPADGDASSAGDMASPSAAGGAGRRTAGGAASDAGGDLVGSAPEPPADDVGLSAGSVDDNAEWEDYLRYRELAAASGVTAHDFPVEGRQVVTVLDGGDRPVLGARVELLAAEGGDEVLDDARTVADGRALLFAPVRPAGDPQQQTAAPAHQVRVTPPGGDSETFPLDRERDTHRFRVEGAAQPDGVRLDVLFLVDATGSMADEIARLKAHMVSVAEQIADLGGDPDVRFAMTVYRDRGDAFVTRTFDFTDDVEAFTDALRDVVADGGGDVPEALNEALGEALAKPSWRGPDTVKLVFLVADAPPHLDRDPDYVESIRAARAGGVKVFAVASSGLDDLGEYVLRQLAQTTLARFAFLTYGADGRSPGDETRHHVDDYSVLSLDELVVKLVEEEVAARG